MSLIIMPYGNKNDDDDDFGFEASGPVNSGKVDKEATPSGVWMKRGDAFIHAEGSHTTLPAGVYRVVSTESGLFFQIMEDAGDDLLDWEGSVVSKTMDDMQSFWSKGQQFKDMGVAHKRGMLLYGPPGSGKTSVLRAVSKEFVEAGGIVLFDQSVPEICAGLSLIRRKEPTRPILVLFEDFDKLVKNYEHTLLSLLDGELQIDRVVFLATTNYPEKLPPRIINRPSRFDVHIPVGMPDANGRRQFLLNRCPDKLGDNIEKWVGDTEGFSMAHLKELLISVFALDVQYEDALRRLKDMLANKSIVPDPERPGHFL